MAREFTIFFENVRFQGVIKTLFYVMLGSLFLAVMSQLALHLPYTPVPQTMQTLGVFLLGGILGAKRGACAVIAYLAQGSMGLPVFAGGAVNPLWFISPTAGFLFSFVIAAFVIGKMLEDRAPSFLFLLAVLGVAQLSIFACGWSFLACFIGPQAAFHVAITPFVVGAGMKIVSAACILKGYLYKNNT